MNWEIVVDVCVPVFMFLIVKVLVFISSSPIITTNLAPLLSAYDICLLIFKGDGFYITDYVKTKNKKEKTIKDNKGNKNEQN